LFVSEEPLPVEELSPMENLLIEHPSIFIRNPLSNFKENIPSMKKEIIPTKVVVQQQKR